MVDVNQIENITCAKQNQIKEQNKSAQSWQ